MTNFLLPPDVEQRALSSVRAARQRQQRIAESVTEDLARRMVVNIRANPNVEPVLIEAASVAGLGPAEVEQMAQESGGWFGSITSGVGNVVGGVTDLLGDAAQGAWEQVVKPVVRTAFTVSEGLSQELIQRPVTAALATLSGDAQSFGQAYSDYGDSALVNLIQGDYDRNAEGGALGTGFFTGGGAQAESMAERTLTIDGKMATFGRALPTSQIAGEVFGYDSSAYNLVAGVQQFAADILLDPAAIAAGVVTGGSSVAATTAAKLGASARTVGKLERGLVQSARLFDASAAGGMIVKGAGRSTVANFDAAASFLGGREVVKALAEADARTIYNSFKRSAANSGFDTELIHRLGKITDENEIAATLLEEIHKGGITQKGFYSGARGFRHKVRSSRAAGVAARGKVSYQDLPDAIDKIDSFLKQARVSDEIHDGIFNDLMSLHDVSPHKQEDAFADVVKRALNESEAALSRADDLDVADDVIEARQEAISQMFATFRNEQKYAREYSVDKLGEVIPGPGVKLDDNGQMLPTVGLTSHLATDGMYLPDVTEVRRAASRLSRANAVYRAKGWGDNANDLARFLTREVFKPAVLLRPAYVLRIGIEEQFRLAAMGYDSLFTHPMRFIQANIKARKLDETFAGDGLLSDREVMDMLGRRADVEADAPRNFEWTGDWDQMNRPEKYNPGFGKWWRRELHQLAAAPEARWFARNGADLDGFVDWARNTDEGRTVIARMDRAYKGRGNLLTDDDALRAHGNMVATHVASKAGGRYVRQGDDYIVESLGDADLLDAIASDNVRGFNLSSKFDLAPDVVKFPTKTKKSPENIKRLQWMTDAIDGMFERITVKPTATLARYPAFRQGYLKYARESFDALASDDARRAYAKQLEQMFALTGKESKQLARDLAAAAGKKGGIEDISEFDALIKHRAGEAMKDALFDATKRSNFQDAHEASLPFYDAWAEVTKFWGTQLKENPGFYLKAMQGLDSARQSGVIYANDFGEEVFATPGGGMLSKFFPGEDSIRLEGRLQGANLAAQGIGPGFGPMVQWGVGAFMPKERGFAQLKEWMAPFGTGGIESAGDITNVGDLFESFTPAWFRKFSNAVTGGQIDPVQFNSTMGDVAKVLAESGEYDPADPADQQRLLNDASRGAKTILMMRGLTQFVSITGATATWQVKTDGDEGEAIPEGWDPEADPDGTFHSIGVLANEYRRLREFYNYDDDIATSVFIDMYGVEPYYYAQAKTRSIKELPVDEQGDFWIKEHADAAEEFSSVIGFFVPPDEDAPLDYAIYRAQIDRGDRQSLTAQQQLQLANQVKARAMKDRVKRLIEPLPSAQQKQVLSQVNAALEELFPGWQAPVVGVDASLRAKDKIAQLERAARDPRLADAEVTPALRAYLAVRDRILQVQGSRGLTTNSVSTSAKAADLREALMQVGLQLRQQNQAFSGVWSRLLSSEVNDG